MSKSQTPTTVPMIEAMHKFFMPTLFVIPVVWYFNRQHISIQAIVEAFVAFAGVYGLLWERG